MYFDRFINVQIDSPIPELGRFNVQGGLEASHDALDLVLNLLHNFNIESSIVKLTEEHLSGCFSILGFVNIYTVIKFAYDSAIWDDYLIQYFSDTNELKIKCRNPESAIIVRVGEHRLERNIFSSKVFVLSKYAEKGSFHKLISKELIGRRKPKRLKSVKIHNNHLEYKLADGFDKASINVELMTYAELTTYYQFLKNEILPNFENLNLHDVITIFSEIQNLLQHLLELERVESDDINLAYESYKINIEYVQLIEYIYKKTNYSKSQIKTVLKLLSQEEGYYNIWERPLISKGKYLIPVLLPAISPNTLRLIDYWLEQGGFDLDVRGTLFEKYIKEAIHSELENKNYYVSIPVTNKFINQNGESEEIDLIIELKSIIIIGEIKCIKYPLNPRDYHNMHKRLKEGALQVKRKTKFIQKNISDFHNVFKDISKEICSIVITNYPIYTGFIFEKIPVTDFSILENYFIHGSLNKSRFGYNGKTIRERDEQPPIIYYQDEEECSRNFSQFINDPIPVRDLKEKVFLSEKQLSLPDAKPKIFMDYALIKDSEVI